MRISIDPKDEGFAPYQEILKRGDRVNVFFNGELQLNATVTADVPNGMIKCFVLGAGGRRIPDRRSALNFRTENRFGQVRIDVIPNTGRRRTPAASDASAIEAARAKRARKRARVSRLVEAGGLAQLQQQLEPAQ